MKIHFQLIESDTPPNTSNTKTSVSYAEHSNQGPIGRIFS